MIHVKINGLTLSNMGFVVLLKGVQDPRTLPIFIGGAEAQAIALRLDNVKIPRPMTHDLTKNIIDSLECRLKRVVINELVETTFYAVLVMERDGLEMEVDARPSDAIALGMRCAAPLYVTQKVMEAAGIVIEDKDGKINEPGESGADTKEEVLSPREIIEQLKAKMEQAVVEERYEEAARLRDELKRFAQSHTKN